MPELSRNVAPGNCKILATRPSPTSAAAAGPRSCNEVGRIGRGSPSRGEKFSVPEDQSSRQVPARASAVAALPPDGSKGTRASMLASTSVAGAFRAMASRRRDRGVTSL
eukprot:CAMPEP_0115836272 /NCGR_PEP_ID=MMETSP0287-20121206/4623_1 /TAXON_ID=412157 /ORGANISM="Chrysochromulina rotalis, Strain UIO044" /LENGTH=108 /DNA_ID=CAMNT_0003289753 /DNA_START=472 /DNA_END=798 /DNA_ORIENTATION=-